MRTPSKLQQYVLKEVLKAFIPALIVFMLIVTLGFCLQLLHEGLDVVRLAGLPRYLLSLSLPTVLPSAFLTAVIIGFARLSADNEVTAMGVSGINLLHVIWPVGALAFVLSCVATHLQFDTVPRARANIALLKYEAIKQILIDRMALSSQTQFNFPPWYVQYDEFRGGQMRDILIVYADASGMPKNIITASRGTVGPDPDPNKRAFIVLRLEDSAVTQLGMNQAGRPVTLKGGSMFLRLRATPDEAYIGSKLKQQSFTELIAGLGRLSKAVRQHPERYLMPERVSEDALQAIRQLSLKADEKNKALAELTKDLTKLQQDETTANQRIASKQEAKQRAQDQKADLEKQRMDYLDRISRLEQGNEGGIVDLASIEDQRQKLLDVTGRIEALNEQITKADADIRDTLAQIQKYKDKAAEKKREVLTLKAESKVIQEALEGRREIRKMADDQEELRSLEIRVHKRLAQAFAVLAFAMIGIPLGIMTKRRSIMIAFGISFGVVLLLFYPFLIIGQMAAESGLLPTVPAMWSGNALTFMIGLALTVHVLRK